MQKILIFLLHIKKWITQKACNHVVATGPLVNYFLSKSPFTSLPLTHTSEAQYGPCCWRLNKCMREFKPLHLFKLNGFSSTGTANSWCTLNPFTPDLYSLFSSSPYFREATFLFLVRRVREGLHAACRYEGILDEGATIHSFVVQSWFWDCRLCTQVFSRIGSLTKTAIMEPR